MNMQSNVVDTIQNVTKKGIQSAVSATPNEEGKVTKTVENQTAKLPSMFWFGLSVASMGASAVMLATSRKKEYANFVGMWAPCFMLIGIYNKLVKLEGNDRFASSTHTALDDSKIGDTLAH